MTYTVGCVPYVNAIPLVEMFEEMGPASPVRVVYRVPSELPALLDSGEAQAILVSSVDALRVPGRRMAEGVCIGSRGPVKSVRLFSKKPIKDIATLALDSSSMTSNRLALIILKEAYGIQPITESKPPNLSTMLQKHDAGVLIGDIGMMSDGSGLTVLDLGEAWVNLTGKPFVWAAWIGNDRLDRDLVWWLQRAAACAGNAQDGEPYFIWKNREAMVARAMEKANWPRDVAQDYFENVMAYRMDDSLLDGLREYQARLLAGGYPEAVNFPELIPAAQSVLVNKP